MSRKAGNHWSEKFTLVHWHSYGMASFWKAYIVFLREIYFSQSLSLLRIYDFGRSCSMKVRSEVYNSTQSMNDVISWISKTEAVVNENKLHPLPQKRTGSSFLLYSLIKMKFTKKGMSYSRVSNLCVKSN